MSKCGFSLAGAGFVVLLFGGASVGWLIGPWREKEPTPSRALPPAGPGPVVAYELAFPALQQGEQEKVIRRIYVSVGDGWRLELWSDATSRLGYGAADTWL